ncbi:hypothetical protein KM043_000149 [Ampulex compressa]|nr:hypothetical protein KM043_000149 [Ampulex compressa]
MPELNISDNDTYISKNGSVGLISLSKEQWKTEMINVAAKCNRDGEPVRAPISSYLLQLVAGINWAFGTNINGVILIGYPGAGRKSATRLAATFSSYRFIDSGPGKFLIRLTE